jgi:hypothetical protein
MDKKTTSNNPKQTKSSTKKETRSRAGNSGKADWMVDPKQAAVRRARSRNFRGCYSVVMVIAILVVVGGLIYVTLR